MRPAKAESVLGLAQSKKEETQGDNGYRSMPSTEYSCPVQRFFDVP
jgi:hypothetical protein